MKTYEEQLLEKEWKLKRQNIIDRDRCCQSCGRSASVRVLNEGLIFNIGINAFTKCEKIIIENKCKISIDDYKKTHQIDYIKVFALQNYDISFGLSKKNHLYKLYKYK